MSWTTKRIPSGRADLMTERIGSGPLVLFLHAGVADRRSWTATMEFLAPRYRCIAYDRRGFGDTLYEPEPFSHLDDLLAVLESLGPEPVVLVGNSQGGRIAIDFTLVHPERVRGLVLVASAVSGAEQAPPRSAAVNGLIADIERADQAGDEELVNALEARFWLDGPEAPAERVNGVERQLFLDMNGRALAAPDPGEEREPPPAMHRLSEIACPTHVVAGGRDVPEITARGRLLVEAIAGATHTVFDGAAHLPQLEDPAGFAADLEGFLAALP